MGNMGRASPRLRRAPPRHRIVALRIRRNPETDSQPLLPHRLRLPPQVLRPQTTVHSRNDFTGIRDLIRPLAGEAEEDPSRRAPSRSRAIRSIHLVKKKLHRLCEIWGFLMNRVVSLMQVVAIEGEEIGRRDDLGSR